MRRLQAGAASAGLGSGEDDPVPEVQCDDDLAGCSGPTSSTGCTASCAGCLAANAKTCAATSIAATQAGGAARGRTDARAGCAASA
jgi:hypothetical protein